MSKIPFNTLASAVDRRAVLGGLAAMSVLRPVQAKAAYPSRPVRVIVPTGPGAAIDTAARGLANLLERHMKVPFVIENKAGANSTIGSTYVARAEPDGYTLLYSSQSLTVNPSLYKLPFDTASAFAPIATVANGPITLVVPTDSPLTSVRDLIKVAKAGSLTYGSAGRGSPPYLSAELFAQKAGVKFVHVPYKGAAAALTDTIAGRLDLMFPSLSLARGFIATKRVRVLGLASAERSALAPDLPTISEEGLPGFVSSAWSGILAPAGTPDAILDTLQNAVRDVVMQDSGRKFLTAQGLDPDFRDRQAFARFMSDDIANWSRVLANIKQD